jgi:putative ABC transport system ATP-binding protein
LAEIPNLKTEISDQEPGPSPRSGSGAAPGPIVELNNVHKFYTLGDARLHVLKGVNLSIGRGEYVAVMGPSGSGKSTLLNLLGLLDVVDSGDYRLAGDDVSRLGDRDLAKRRNSRIGFVFQSFNLFPQLDVVGNIEVPMVYGRRPLRQRRERARELAETVGLGHRLHHRPRHLSGGEMQRTAIARALANEAPLLLADEPTGNLDETTGNEIMELFDRLVAAGQTMILVTHNPAYKGRVQRVLRMHDGRVESDRAVTA